MKTAVYGSWHLAEVYAVGLAELGHQVRLISSPEINEGYVKGTPPVFEPGIKEGIEKYTKAGMLSFSSNAKDPGNKAEVCFFAQDCIMTDDGIDEKDINGHILKVAKSGLFETIVVSSQTPIGTARAWQKKYPKVSIVYFPEFLRFGDALKRFVEPDYIVLGGDAKAVEGVLSFFEKIQSPKFTVSLEEAEMSKHAANTFVATTVSFISELSKFSEHFNINFENIGKILRADKRVGPKAYTLPGLGFTGTVGRDFKVLKKVGKKLGIKLPMFEQVVAVNDEHNLFIERELKRTLKNMKGKKIAFLGATYKPFTSNLRGSIIEPLMKKLTKAGAEVVLFDPLVESSYQVPTINEAYRKADALVIVVPKKEFVVADHKALVKTMKQKIVIDAANMLPKADAAALGARYSSIARGILPKS